MLDTLLILYPSVFNFGAQTAQGPRLSICRQLWSLKISPIWGLKMTKAFLFVFEVQLSKAIVVEVPHRVLTVFYKCKLALAKMIV